MPYRAGALFVPKKSHFLFQLIAMLLPNTLPILAGLACVAATQIPLQHHVQQQPTAPGPNTRVPLRNLTWGKINFLHTTDTHAWYAGHLNQKNYGADWGDYISFVHHMRREADARGVDLLVVDSGDKRDGNGLSDASEINGEESTKFFVLQDFDLLGPGNHELYLSSSSYQEYESVVAKFGNRYLAANVELLVDNEWHTMGSRYRLFETKNQKLRVLSFGFLFNFKRFNPQTRVIPVEKMVKQQWFVDVLKNAGKLDLVVVVGHLPVQVGTEFPEILHIQKEIRKYFPDVPVTYFGGHSHIRDFTKIDANAVGLQSGRYCETVGWLSVSPSSPSENADFHRTYIDFNLHSFWTHSHKTPATFPTLKGTVVSKQLAESRESLNLTHVFGYVPRNYLVIDNTYPSSSSLYRFLETEILPTLPVINREKTSRVVAVNTGSIRYDLYKGPFTLDTMFIVSPFKNKWLTLSNVSYSVVKDVIDTLNGLKYIISASASKESILSDIDTNLGYIGNFAQLSKARQTQENLGHGLSKGYVTCDDYGCDGDDTPHIPFAKSPKKMPNIIHSTEIIDGNTDSIDFVFYDFLRPYVVAALNEVSGEQVWEFKHYGDLPVSTMLRDYVSEHWRHPTSS